MDLCIRCKEKHASYGFDDKHRIWCSPCAQIEYMGCMEDNGRWPSQIRYLTFTKEQEYISEQVLPQQINFLI